MRRLRTGAMVVVLVGLLGGCDAWEDAAGAADSSKEVEHSLAEAISDLSVEVENRDGYDRDAFAGWNDLDSDGCDTRDEVLIDEETTGSLTAADCDAAMAGEWVSIYDGETITQSSKLDIDHFVPLAEAWDSGASQWGDIRRDKYATYLDDDRHLVAVTASSNRSKGDRDPAEWLPTNEKATCEYVATWVAIKTAWGLSIDKAEHDALTDQATQCPKTQVDVRPV